MRQDLSVSINQAYDWFITITGVKVEELSINANNNIEVTSVNGAWPSNFFKIEEWDVYEKTPEHFIIKEVLRSIIGINKSNYPARGEA